MVPTTRAARPARLPAAITTAVALTLALLLAGCGATTTTGTGTGSGTTSGSTPPGSTTGPATVPPATAAPPAPYPSAITGSTVANPEFGPLTRDIEQRITEAGLPGASLLVLHEGELVEQQALGSYTLDTVVPIASASKWLAGATIMTVVDEGRIDLDAPIRTYLPQATGPSGRITMRQLVSLTSGLEYDDRIPCYGDLSVTLAACTDQILDLPLLGPPGSGFRYTGTHLFVAAAVAEAVTGQTWEQLFQTRIAGPLGMDRTTFTAARRATAPDGHPQPAGSAVSTLGDYGRFLEMLVHDGVAPDGTVVLSSDAVREMGEDQTGDAAWLTGAANRKAAETPYGVGHWLDLIDADGITQVESSPGKFGFRPWIDHTNDIAGVFLIDDRDDSHVTDSPDRAAGSGADAVQTSGQFVVVGTARAVGGQVPSRLER